MFSSGEEASPAFLASSPIMLVLAGVHSINDAARKGAVLSFMTHLRDLRLAQARRGVRPDEPRTPRCELGCRLPDPGHRSSAVRRGGVVHAPRNRCGTFSGPSLVGAPSAPLKIPRKKIRAGYMGRAMQRRPASIRTGGVLSIRVSIGPVLCRFGRCRLRSPL